MEPKRIDPNQDEQRQPAPDKILQGSSNHRGSTPDIPAGKMKARGEGRGAER